MKSERERLREFGIKCVLVDMLCTFKGWPYSEYKKCIPSRRDDFFEEHRGFAECVVDDILADEVLNEK